MMSDTILFVKNESSRAFYNDRHTQLFYLDIASLSHTHPDKHITMASPAVVSVTKISANDIHFAEAKRNKQGGMSIGFKYINQNVQFRFPLMSFPGGCIVKENENKDGSTTMSYMLSASLSGCDPYAQEPATNNDDTAKAYNFLRDFQERVIQAAVENSPKWFGKKRGEESIRDSFNRFLTVSVDKTTEGYVPNGKYPPSLRYKLPVYDGKVCMEIIDESNDDIEVRDPSELTSVFGKGSSAKIVAQGSIYVVGQSFGVTWKPTYVQMSKKAKKNARDMFAEDEDDVEEAVEKIQEDGTTEEANTVPAEEVVVPTSTPPAEPAVPVDSKPATVRRRKVA